MLIGWIVAFVFTGIGVDDASDILGKILRGWAVASEVSGFQFRSTVHLVCCEDRNPC